MRIAGLIKTSLIEWPGKISSVIFVSGCNFFCSFCQNADLVEPKKIKKLPAISEKEILKNFKKRKKWLDGVVVSGGEPTLQPDLPDFLKKIKSLGLETMVETNGSKPEVMSNLVMSNLVNYVAIDFKVPLEDYRLLTKIKNIEAKIKKFFAIILKSKIPFEIRTTIVPGIHNEKILLKMAKQLTKMFKCSNIQMFKWQWQNFQPKNCLNPEFIKIKPYSKIELEGFLKAVKKIIPEVKLRD